MEPYLYSCLPGIIFSVLDLDTGPFHWAPIHAGGMRHQFLVYSNSMTSIHPGNVISGINHVLITLPDWSLEMFLFRHWLFSLLSLVSVANENSPEHALRPSFLSTFALATDQGSKLGLSKNKSIICYYNTYQVVQFNRLPLVVSFIASSDANTGLILSLEKELGPLFEELRQVVENSWLFGSQNE